MSRPLLLCALLLCAAPAAAHNADILFAQASRGDDGTVHQRLTLTAGTLLLLAPIDADEDGDLTEGELEAGAEAIGFGIWEQVPLSAASGPCRRTAATARLRDTYVQLDAAFSCGTGELTQVFKILSVLPSAYKVVLGAYGQGELRGQAFAQGRQQTLTLLGERAPEGSARRGVWGWFALGVEHIFRGIDHLAFLLAVILVGGGWRRVLLLVTSFTLAHSITLGAVALGLVQLSAAWATWVEVLIALSILWVALENLVLRQHRHRALLTFAFGLVHGFGFASVLAGYGLGDEVAAGLFGFNLGVEAGQAAVVVALFPLIRLAARQKRVEVWTVRLASTAVFIAGAAWLWDRLPR